MMGLRSIWTHYSQLGQHVNIPRGSRDRAVPQTREVEAWHWVAGWVDMRATRSAFARLPRFPGLVVSQVDLEGRSLVREVCQGGR